MPDLSHRPSRYAVAAVSAVALAAAAASSVPVHIGPDRAAEAAAAEKRADHLHDRVVELERTLAQSRADSAGHDVGRDRAQGTRPANAGGAATRSSTPNCATYPYQEDAQQAFADDPVRFAAFDGDGDSWACEQLKSRGAALLIAERSVPPQEEPSEVAGPLPTAPTKEEIVGSGHHFGLATATTEEFDLLEFSLARDATMRGYFKGFDTRFDSNRVVASWERGEVPAMTWESRALANADDTTDYSLARIAAGAFDEYLATYARDIAALGLPLVIRLDHEMNGDWYRWSETNPDYHNAKGDYIRMWRHVHDVFEAEGANRFVVWLWSPNRVGTSFPTIDNYYPGAEYVDWVGVTGYYRSGDAEATFRATYNSTLAELRRVAQGKPILLSEVGATEDGDHKVDWVQSFFRGLAVNPDIAGFIWFNYAISEDGHTNDWRLNSSQAVFDAFAEALANSSFGRERGKRAVLVPRGDAATAGLTEGPTTTTEPPAPPDTTTPAGSTTATTTTASPTTPTTTQPSAG